MKKGLLITSFFMGVLVTGASFAADSKVSTDQHVSHHQHSNDEMSQKAAKVAHVHDHKNNAKLADKHASEHEGSHIKAHMHDHNNDKGSSEAHSHHH